MASKPITIRWTLAGSQPDWKIMFSIELQAIFYDYQNKNHKINTRFVSLGLRPLGADKTGFNRLIFHSDICGKLSIMRCDKCILHRYLFYEIRSMTHYALNLISQNQNKYWTCKHFLFRLMETVTKLLPIQEESKLAKFWKNIFLIINLSPIKVFIFFTRIIRIMYIYHNYFYYRDLHFTNRRLYNIK